MAGITVNTAMKQINVEAASKEQLVDFIRRMHPLLQREQERARELESQVSGLQAFIYEKNAEIRELRQQSERLAEKSASDEETISTLIKQMEDMCSGLAPSPSVLAINGTAVVPLKRRAEHGKGKSHPSADTATGEYAPETHHSLDKIGNSDVGHQPSCAPSLHKEGMDSALDQSRSQSASPMGNKMEEILALKNKVQELMEVNAFYSAIVSQHDQEEKVRMSQVLARCSGHPDYDVADFRQEVERLQLRISNMCNQSEKLQRTIKAVEAEKATLREENEVLRRESVLLEAEMVEVAREYARARKSLVAVAATSVRPSASLDQALALGEEVPQVRAASEHPQGLLGDLLTVPTPSVDAYVQQSDRSASHPSPGTASRVSPLAGDERQRMNGLVPHSAQTVATMKTAQSHSRFAFRSLRPMRVRNPDAHERELLDRIRLYEEQFAQMEAFESDRQRSFDDMERNRAELFVSMNNHIEKQRKEIHRLRKLYEETSPKSSMTARPSRNYSVTSSRNREEEAEGGSSRHCVSGSPVEHCLTAVPTSSQSLRIVDSVDGLDGGDDTAPAWTLEGENAVSHDRHRQQIGSAFPSVTFGPLDELMWREEYKRSHICIEAVEEELQLFLDMHTSTVRLSASELKARESELLRKTAGSVSDVDALQTRVVELAAQLGGSVEAENVFVCNVKESGARATTGVSDTNSTEMNVLHIASSLWEDKALLMVFMALEAYTTVLEYHAQFIESLRVSNSSVEKVTLAEDCCIDADIARDLEEVRVVLGAVRCPLQSQLFLTQEAAPHLCAESSGQKRVDERLAASQADTNSREAEVQGASIADHTVPYRLSPQTVSPFTQAPIASLSAHTNSANSKEGILHGVVDDVKHMEVMFASPEMVLHEQTSERSVRSTLRGTTCEAQEERSDGDSGLVVASFQKVDAQTVGVVIEAPGDEAVPLSLSTEEAVTDATFHQDSLDRPRCHGSTATSCKGGAGSVYSRSSSSLSGKGSPGTLLEGHSTSAKVKAEAERETISSTGLNSLAAKPLPAQSSFAGSADLKQSDSTAEDSGAGDAGDESSVASYESTLKSASQLVITEGEEAQFLEQLNREMAGGELEKVAGLRDAEDGTAASPDDLVVDHVSGEDRDPRCSEHQRSETGATPAEVPSVENVSLFSSRSGARRQKGIGDGSQDEDLDFAVLQDKLDESTTPPMESPDRRSGKSGVASSPAPLSNDVSVQRPSTSRTSTSLSLSSTPSAARSPSGDSGHFDRVAACDHTVPKHPVPVVGGAPPSLPPTSLDELFGPSGDVAYSSSVHRSDGPPFGVSPTPRPLPSFSDPYTTLNVSDVGAVMGLATSPNALFEPRPQQVSLPPYISSSPPGGQHLQPSSDPKNVYSHDSSSPDDDFEADFDPFA
ncbi:hypothetical protein JKF63_04891 [Porcisia hertigi]|uniref:Uncharacterized protein n=1 Tax=Porcisia hertigi TaxID=2761500 RepID=A0A836LAA1_9TRYP|nr:hypothetical protein JKF63_04891 [Porcisia hertigi]